MSQVDHADVRARVEKSLGVFLAGQRAVLAGIDPVLEPVADTIESFVLGGGKRLRPQFAYWGFRGAGGSDCDEVVAAVSALELVHASALIHDDVMDGSDTRRGEPSAHRRFAALHAGHRWAGDPDAFGAGSAILLGDLCLTWSDELLRCAGLHPAALLRAQPVFDLMRTEVIAGQYLDVYAQATGDSSMRRVATVIRYKSAKYTVERPLQFGAAIADASPQTMLAYSAFGLPLGEAFQLRDDILGVFGDPAQTGKPAGDDLREGKRTYLIAAALGEATPAEADDLRRWLGNPDLDEAGVARLRQIIVRTRALDQAERRIRGLTETALTALGQVRLAGTSARMLSDLAMAATRRSG